MERITSVSADLLKFFGLEKDNEKIKMYLQQAADEFQR